MTKFENVKIGEKFKCLDGIFLKTEKSFDRFGIPLEATCISSPNKNNIGHTYAFFHNDKVDLIFDTKKEEEEKNMIKFEYLEVGDKFKYEDTILIKTEKVTLLAMEVEAVCIDSPWIEDIGKFFSCDKDLEVEVL